MQELTRAQTALIADVVAEAIITRERREQQLLIRREVILARGRSKPRPSSSQNLAETRSELAGLRQLTMIGAEARCSFDGCFAYYDPELAAEAPDGGGGFTGWRWTPIGMQIEDDELAAHGHTLPCPDCGHAITGHTSTLNATCRHPDCSCRWFEPAVYDLAVASNC